MYIFLLIVHVLVCLVLILVVLLQAGRGGGFSDMMGGGQPQSIFGTQTNAFMTRATEVCAVIFVITSLGLGLISSHRGRSLMERRSVVDAVKGVFPPVPVTAPELPPKLPPVLDASQVAVPQTKVPPSENVTAKPAAKADAAVSPASGPSAEGSAR